MSIRTIAVSTAVAAACVSVTVSSAYAHGFGERYDLPIPLNLFMVAAAAAVAASFVVIGLFVNRKPGETWYPRYNLLAVPVLGALLQNKALSVALKLVGVAVFLLVVAAGLFGVNRPVENFAPTFVWIVWWVGMGYVSALLGNLWMLLNPWKTIFEWVERFVGSGDGEDAGLFDYPAGLGAWPAVAFLLVFGWLENVYSGSSVPFRLALIVLAYSAVTWAGMLLFGKHVWLRNGEVFSVLFGLFARFSPTEARTAGGTLCSGCAACTERGAECVDCYECWEKASPDQREFNVRPFAVGLANRGVISLSTSVFVIVALAAVTFDGISETNAWLNVQDVLHPVISPLPVDTFGAIDTIGLLIGPALFLMVYLAFCWVLRLAEGSRGAVFDVARVFVVSLVPIALAYNIAHFISLLAIAGQGIIPLLSNPFGWGWDLLGTADYRVNIDIISAGFVWWVSIIAIVLGHVFSVYVAHVIALRRMPTSARAVKSQYPMLVLMIVYTATSLWIIAQPIAN